MLQVLNSYGGHGTILMRRFEIVCLELQLEVRVGCLHFPVITFAIVKENSIESIARLQYVLNYLLFSSIVSVAIACHSSK